MTDEQKPPADAVGSSEGLGRYWRAEVDCWYREKRRSKVNKRVRRTVVLWAPDSDDAIKLAVQHCADTAPMGPLWVGFEAISAATVKLPLTVASWHAKAVTAA